MVHDLRDMIKDTPILNAHNTVPRRAVIEKIQEMLLQPTLTKCPLNSAPEPVPRVRNAKPVPRVRIQDETQHHKMPLTHVELPHD